MLKKNTTAQNDALAKELLISARATVRKAFGQLAQAAEKLRASKGLLDDAAQLRFSGQS